MIFNFRYLRPTGNKINLADSPIDKELFKGFEVNFFQSGTAALSAAIIACHSQNKIENPEVILPAYACPDLISAVLHANATPVLIDLEADTPWISLNEFEKNINKNTLAIIAINFLGITERTTKIKNICTNHDLFLIEDSAQGLPDSNYEDYWQGDIIILSFGRGKPLNLLGGGATLVHKNSKLHNMVKSTQPEESSFKKKLIFNLKIVIYNILIAPYFYNLLTKIPGINLGKTIFKPLLSINSISRLTLSKLQSNLNTYKSIIQDNNKLSNGFNTLNNKDIIDLTRLQSKNIRLLRHPFLIKDQKLKNALLTKYSNYGLSEMYKMPLNKIPGLENILDNKKNYPNADIFSKNLVTFPTHNDFNSKHITDIKNFIRSKMN